MLEFIVNQFQK